MVQRWSFSTQIYRSKRRHVARKYHYILLSRGSCLRANRGVEHVHGAEYVLPFAHKCLKSNCNRTIVKRAITSPLYEPRNAHNQFKKIGDKAHFGAPVGGNPSRPCT